MEVYRTVQGDTWDLISKRVYGDERKMGLLMQANFDQLDRVVFPSGILIQVPEITKEQAEDLPVWRR